jgi:adsorption protein B
MAPLALWVILNGFDDLFIVLAAAYAWLRFRFTSRIQLRSPTEAELDAVPQRRMAIFVCLWHEHSVIRDMVEHNIRRIRYRNYDFFIGVYPNDTPTVAAATEVCNRYRNVHLSMTPHPGGTSKADNLNWIFQRMLLYEEGNNVRFEMIVVHDAEDVIHPDDLRWLNYFAQWYDMVQIPVLALPTPLRQFTHGVYCDEFAEFQFKDMPAREALGGFVPSCGVGTGFSRRALESIAAAHSNQIFDATSLTEDYEIGFRIHRLGYRQKFIRILRRDGSFVATREFFAQTFRRAVTQRSRWVTGIGLQSWQKHGYRDTLSQVYWFWRDRKGLVCNVLTPLTNVLCLYGIITWIIASSLHTQWGLGGEFRVGWLWKLGWWPALLVIPQLVIRIYCSRLVYGWKFALLVPFRVPWANLINCCAAFKAIWSYADARIRGLPLRWLKTEHAYPNRAALVTERRKLGEILVDSGYVTGQELDAALAAQPVGVRIGEYLMQLGKLSEEQLYEALGLQQDLPAGKPHTGLICPEVTRAIPADLARRWTVLPFRVVAGQLYVATQEVPTEQTVGKIREFWPFEMRFHLVNPRAFKELIDEYLPPLAPASVPGLLTGLGLLASLVAISRTWRTKNCTESSPAVGSAQVAATLDRGLPRG